MKRIAIAALIGALATGVFAGGSQLSNIQIAKAASATTTETTNDTSTSTTKKAVKSQKTQNKKTTNSKKNQSSTQSTEDKNVRFPGRGHGMGRGTEMIDSLKEKINEIEDETTKADLLAKLEKVQKLQKEEQEASQSLMESLKEAGIIDEKEMMTPEDGERPEMAPMDGERPEMPSDMSQGQRPEKKNSKNGTVSNSSGSTSATK